MSALRRFLIMPVLALIEKIVTFCINLPNIGFHINLWLSQCASFVRWNAGAYVPDNIESCKRPTQMLILYEYEGCPFCRRVREAISCLALDVMVYPCPRVTLAEYGVTGNSRYRDTVSKLVGKCIFPVLVDNNRTDGDPVIQDSAHIVEYLWEHYGKESKPSSLMISQKKSKPAFLAAPIIFRPLPSMGVVQTPSRLPAKPLELYGYENHPATRLIRERLDSLELPYISRTMPIGAAFKDREFKGRFKLSVVMLPLLVDNNRPSGNSVDNVNDNYLTNVQDILNYLTVAYAAGEPLCTSWYSYSTKGATSQHGVMN